MNRNDIIDRLPPPTIIRQAVEQHFDPQGRRGVFRTAQIISIADQTFFFQTYDVYPNGNVVLDHSECWTTAQGAESAWTQHGWDETDVEEPEPWQGREIPGTSHAAGYPE